MSDEASYKTEVLKNFIPKDVIEVLKSLVTQAIASAKEEEIVRAYHGDYYMVGQEASDILSKLLPLMPNEACRVSMLRHTKVTGPHTDTNIPDHDLVSDPKKFGRTIIIPLETQDTCTITFNEKLPFGSVGKEMIPYVMNLPDVNAITEDVINKYFHNSKDDYWISKLSVETIFPWIAGDILMFDRNRIHTGDDHLGKIDKQGLVIWTTLN